MTSKLSLTGKKWIIPEVLETNGEDLVKKLMANRGIDSSLEGELPDAFAFHDMQKAVDRIRSAIKSNESIGIFGDYDCDGVTSTLQLIRFFRRNSVEPHVRLPHRINDGYGLKSHIIDEFISKGTNLLITVDSGVGSVTEIKKAKDAGMDVIVTDHHHVGKHIPPAVAIIHPDFSDIPPPHPSGSGVVYHLLRALEDGVWDDMQTDEALAMLGMIADVMELKGFNRTLVKQGLNSIKKLTKGPLVELIRISGININYITSTYIGFRIAPRINAAGRMGDPMIALEALMDGGDAIKLIDNLNEIRQKQTEEFLNIAIEEISKAPSGPLLSIMHADFPQGIVGLIAGKLTEMTGKPSLVGREHDGMCTASLRSPRCYHITEGLERCSDLLQYFGGHAQAAGCSFRSDLFDQVSTRLAEDVSGNTEPDDLLPSIEIDATLPAESITLELIYKLRTLEPFGHGNREPVFLIQGAQMEYQKQVGSECNHLQTNIDGVKSIGFRLGHLIEHTNEPVDVVCRLGTDNWNGLTRPQIFVEDFRLSISVENRI
ncbi:TPA: single-stranded-DNA-specific exonuclease RecJ [Candidatus Peribacteria bacterium]|nr:single-stranded-DNA-specific exonuclease RecJ [Candidatus Peribacteria bacterium]